MIEHIGLGLGSRELAQQCARHTVGDSMASHSLFVDRKINHNSYYLVPAFVARSGGYDWIGHQSETSVNTPLSKILILIKFSSLNLKSIDQKLDITSY